MNTSYPLSRLWRRSALGITLAIVLSTMFALSATFLLPAKTSHAAPAGAGFTTFDATQGGCLDSPNGINCNNYVSKDDVYMSGGPTGGGSLSDGCYYFAVLAPGSQNGGFIDGATGNLSSPHDTAGNRTFSVSSQLITYPDTSCASSSGGHGTGTSPNGKFIVQLSQYDDTPNPGGVYILAICQVNATSASQCKYDAFRVPPAVVPPATDLVISKTATPSFTRTFTWGITKAVDKTLVEQIGGTATFTYTVKVTHSAAVDSNWQVNGNITVVNPNTVAVSGVNITDIINDPNASCVVTGGTNLTLVASGSVGDTVVVPYTCTYSAAPASNSETNTATVNWDNSTLGAPDSSASFDVSFTFDDGSAGNPTLVDNCVTVTDTFNGGSADTLGTVCAGNSPAPSNLNLSNLANFSESYDSTARTFTFTYSRTVNVPTFNCVFYKNTATFTTNTNGKTGSASQTVKVCGPAKTGALTMGFWQNKNGQGINLNKSGTNCQALATYLHKFNPFSDLTATTCGSSPALGGTTSTGVVGYVYSVIKAAVCTSTSNTCNSMLKAQMLATALDVYFSANSDPTLGALGGNQIGATGDLGQVSIDLTMICAPILSGPSCGAYVNVSSAFGGTPKMVADMLLYQNTSDPLADGGAVWYGQVKATQVLAKDAFDAINNQVAFSP